MTGDPTALGANPYVEPDIANHYASLEEYEGTYRLAVRDLPDIVARLVSGRNALDFACGAGRCTRLLKSLGFDTVSVDGSAPMLDQARQRDPDGAYLLIADDNFSALKGREFNLIVSAFPLGNATRHDKIVRILAGLRALLASGGRIIVIEPTVDLYVHEWLSFTTVDFPDNRKAGSGDPVSIAFRDLPDRPVVDILWTDADYRRACEIAGLRVLEMHRPLGRDDDPEPWLSERQTAPWVVYVLGPRS